MRVRQFHAGHCGHVVDGREALDEARNEVRGARSFAAAVATGIPHGDLVDGEVGDGFDLLLDDGFHLLDHEIKTQPSSSTPLDAFSRTIQFLEGSWAIAAIIKGMDGILVARNGAPLIVGRGHGCICVSSDSQPFFGRSNVSNRSKKQAKSNKVRNDSTNNLSFSKSQKRNHNKNPCPVISETHLSIMAKD